MRRLLPLILLLAGLPAWAQERPGNLQPEPAIPPPPPSMSSWDNALEPQVTIRANEKETREEYRVGGRLYMVKVTPAGGGKPYFLVDRTGDGTFSQMDSVTPATRPPMWVIKEF